MKTCSEITRPSAGHYRDEKQEKFAFRVRCARRVCSSDPVFKWSRRLGIVQVSEFSVSFLYDRKVAQVFEYSKPKFKYEKHILPGLSLQISSKSTLNAVASCLY